VFAPTLAAVLRSAFGIETLEIRGLIRRRDRLGRPARFGTRDGHQTVRVSILIEMILRDETSRQSIAAVIRASGARGAMTESNPAAPEATHPNRADALGRDWAG
jgi:hypothetical protein